MPRKSTKPRNCLPMHPITEDSVQASSNVQMMQMIGLSFGILLTGIFLTLGISSLLLLSFERGNRNFLRRNHFLCVYIIVLLLTVPTFEAERFIVVNSSTIFFSQPQDTLHKILGIWGIVSGLTTVIIVLLTDGVLVRLSHYSPSILLNERSFKVWRCFMVQKALGPFNSSKWGNVFWIFPVCLWILTLGMDKKFEEIYN